MRSCPKCKKEFTLSERLCPHDGSVLEEQTTSLDEPVGKILDGKYRIEGFVSKGGMGAVYRATHVMLNRPAAVKLINPELVTSSDIVERFQREARAAANLNHANIVTVYDLGQAENGVLYIAMELVDGQSLKQLIRNEGALEPSRAFRILRDICLALGLAHRNKIIHRDLKPQNIMMAEDAEGREVPKLLDFGIAKMFQTDGTALTSTGMVIGTPQYMAPEQAKGLDVDNRSDIYSLGIILYEMLVGKVPFDDKSVPAVLVKHLSEPPKPPTELRPGLPPAMEAIVLRCLAKEPDARFQNVEDLKTAMDAALGAPTAVEAPAVATPPPLPAIPAKTVGSPSITGVGAAVPATMGDFGADPGTMPTELDAPAQPTSEPTVRAPGRQAPAERRGRGGLLVAAFGLLGLIAVAAFFFFRGGDGASDGAFDTTTGSQASAPVAAVGEPPPAVPEASGTGVSDNGNDSGEPATTDGSGPVATEAPPAVTAPVASSPAPLPAQARAPSPAPVPVPAAPAPVLPETPSVFVYCEGLSDGCSAARSAMVTSLEGAGMRSVEEDRADVVVRVLTEEIEARSETNFGQTFIIRTYSFEAEGDVVSQRDRIEMPMAEIFSFDTRFGREKLNERSRVFAAGVVRALSKDWSRRLTP